MTYGLDSRRVEMVWNRWMRVEVVEPVGWKANWSEKVRPCGGTGGVGRYDQGQQSLPDSGENWSYGDWSVVGGRGKR